MYLSNCPFCGHSFHDDLSDSLYPSGTVWRETENGKTYHSWRDQIEGDSSCWKIICNECEGGCGVEMVGDTKEEVIAKWNRRIGTEK